MGASMVDSRGLDTGRPDFGARGWGSSQDFFPAMIVARAALALRIVAGSVGAPGSRMG